MLLVTCSVLYVAGRTVDEACDFLIGELPDDLARRAHNQGAGWVDLAFGDEGTGTDQTMFANHRMVQNGAADTDQAALANATAVQHNLVANRDIGLKNQGCPRVGMEDAAVLDVRARADDDRFIVTPQNSVPPNRTVFGALDAANQDGTGRHPGCRVDFGDPVFQLIAAHERVVSSKMGGAAFYAVPPMT